MHRQSRRQFIRETLAGSGSLGAAAGLPVDSVALQRLRGQLKGRLILPTDAEYDAARRVNFWNPETEKRPAVIARCARADDVRYAVDFARRHGLETAVRGGGHSHMAMSTSNGMVIDLAGMKQVSIEAAKRTARMDAGVLSGEAMRAAGVHGLAPVAGQCPGVGIAGVTLGGGLGWLSGLYGACCDNLISARLVAADGRIVEVDAERNAELLWAMQGAGANFGVAVSMEYRLYPVGPVLSGDIFYPVGAAREVLRFFRDFMAEAPDGFQATLNLTPGARGVFLSLCHAGAEEEGARLLRALRKVVTPSKDTVHRQEFAELAGRATAGAAGVNFRCTATVYREELSDELIDRLLDRLSHAPVETVVGLSHYMHGEVCRVRPEATAFPLRNAGGIHIRIGLDWNDPTKSQRFLSWAEEARQQLRPASGERIYANYQSHAGKGTPQLVYGVNYSRLVALKNKYDPANFFRRNSNVVPSGKA